jgi:hypothetical protein
MNASPGADYSGLSLPLTWQRIPLILFHSGTYGITTSGNALTLKFVTGEFLHSRLSISVRTYFAVSQQPNIGSRVYLLAPGSTSQYQTFDFRNQEFVSPLQCSGSHLITHLFYFLDVSLLCEPMII